MFFSFAFCTFFKIFHVRLGKKSKSVSFSRVYVCVKAKLTLVSFFTSFSCAFPLAIWAPSWFHRIYQGRKQEIWIHKLYHWEKVFDLFNILISETTFFRKFADADVVGHWHTGMVASFSFPDTPPFWKWNIKET